MAAAPFNFQLSTFNFIFLWLYRLLLPRRYARYLQRAGGNVDKCHEALLHGTYYEEYDSYDFAHKSPAERRTYVTDAYRNRLCRRINDAKQQAVVMDKYRTAMLYSDYYRRKFMLCESDEQCGDFVRFGMDEGCLVVKPIDDCAGRGVQLLHAEDEQGWRIHYQQMMEQGRRYIVEQRIIQHSSMARWNESSVNTVRINTLNRNGCISVLTANIRCGCQGAFCDNCAQGGYCANIDPATGIIITPATSKGPEKYDRHPNSGITFLGEQMPCWQELLKAAYDCARRLPKLVYVSWDFALTADGWTLVEANKGELIADQRNLGRGLKDMFRGKSKSCFVNLLTTIFYFMPLAALICS